MAVTERMRDTIAPAMAELEVELVDIEQLGATVRVTIDRPGGIDLELISRATRRISHLLDELDPMADRYTLEVSSPGLERPLRTRRTSCGRSARTVSVKTQPGVEGDRRVTGIARLGGRRRRSSVEAGRRPPHGGSATTRSSGPAPCSSGVRHRSPGRPGPRSRRRRRRRQRAHDRYRHDGGAAGARRGEGHLGRDADGRAGRRPGVRLQAAARRVRVRLGHHRPRHRARCASPRRSSTRTASRSAPRSTSHPSRHARPHRRADVPPGDDAAPPRGRPRDEVRGVRRPRGRHRHRHHPAERLPLHAARPRPGRGAAAPGRAGALRAARARTAGSRPTSSRSARRRRAPRSWSAAPTRASSSGCSSSRCPRSPTASSRSRPAPASPGTARRSPCGRTTPTSTRSAPASAPAAPASAWSSTSCAARRSTSSRSPRTCPTSWPRRCQPAKVKEVRIDEETGTAEVIVPDYQLSLAIGKEGQNARLAARLTGWRVDIKSETQLAEEEAYATDEWAQGEWVIDPATGEQVWQPADGGEAVSAEAVGPRRPRAAGDEVPPPPPVDEADAADAPTTAEAGAAAEAVPTRRRRAPCRRGRRRREDAAELQPAADGRRRGAGIAATGSPQRTCVGCRRRGPTAHELVRVARRADGSLAVGRTLPGRGAWLCSGSRSCFDLAVKREAFRRAFRAPVDRSAVDQLRSELFGGDARHNRLRAGPPACARLLSSCVRGLPGHGRKTTQERAGEHTWQARSASTSSPRSSGSPTRRRSTSAGRSASASRPTRRASRTPRPTASAARRSARA